MADVRQHIGLHRRYPLVAMLPIRQLRLLDGPVGLPTHLKGRPLNCGNDLARSLRRISLGLSFCYRVTPVRDGFADVVCLLSRLGERNGRQRSDADIAANAPDRNAHDPDPATVRHNAETKSAAIHVDTGRLAGSDERRIQAVLGTKSAHRSSPFGSPFGPKMVRLGLRQTETTIAVIAPKVWRMSQPINSLILVQTRDAPGRLRDT